MERDRDFSRQQSAHARHPARGGHRDARENRAQHVPAAQQASRHQPAHQRRLHVRAAHLVARQPLRQKPHVPHQTLLIQNRLNHPMLRQTNRQTQM